MGKRPGCRAGVSAMTDPEEPVFIDDDELIDTRQALCVLREHLSETLPDPISDGEG